MRGIAQNNNASTRRARYEWKDSAKPVGDVWVQRCLWCFCMFTLLLFCFDKVALAVPPGTVISNTANANFDIAGSAQVRASNTVDITTVVNLTPADISFLQYSPTGAGATLENTSPTGW